MSCMEPKFNPLTLAVKQLKPTQLCLRFKHFPISTQTTLECLQTPASHTHPLPHLRPLPNPALRPPPSPPRRTQRRLPVPSHRHAFHALTGPPVPRREKRRRPNPAWRGGEPGGVAARPAAVFAPAPDCERTVKLQSAHAIGAGRWTNGGKAAAAARARDQLCNSALDFRWRRVTLQLTSGVCSALLRYPHVAFGLRPRRFLTNFHQIIAGRTVRSKEVHINQVRFTTLLIESRSFNYFHSVELAAGSYETGKLNHDKIA